MYDQFSTRVVSIDPNINMEVETRFTVINTGIKFQYPSKTPMYLYEVVIEDEIEASKKFQKLLEVLEKRDMIAVLKPVKSGFGQGSRFDHRANLVVVPLKAKIGQKNNYLIPIILFFATLGSILLAGLQHAQSFKQLVDETGMIQGLLSLLVMGVNTGGTSTESPDVLLVSIFYAIGLMSIIGVHELGHVIAARAHGIEASPPYFIPMPFNGLGTFGAFITQKKPAVNRNVLFDIGISGPLLGFVVALVTIVIGFSLSIPVETSTATPGGGLPFDFLLFDILGDIFFGASPGKTIALHPLAFAGWIGLLLTGLNLLPVSMLDGGHVFRSVLDEKTHQMVSFIGVVVLSITGFFLMAILILFLAPRHPGALDEVGPLTPARKLLFVVIVVLTILTFPIPNLDF
ncbi:MAG: site-2 protease family protein [Candidatus Hodarchaeales archaeon]|jgi:Zn-dependent protease